MSASHRRARVSALVALGFSLGGVCCARGRQTADGSALGVAAPTARFETNGADATAPYAPYAAGDDGADAVAVIVGDDADTDGGGNADTDGGGDFLDSDADGLGSEPATADPVATTPAPGDLAITEVMLSPSGPEPESEWFEIYNLASSPRLLGGLTIEDGYGDVAVITPAVALAVPSAAYALLVRDKRGAERTGITASSIAYAYGEGLAPGDGIELDEGAAGDLSLWNGSTLLADVPYGMWDASWLGQSIELASPQSDASDPGQWCVAQSPWAAGSDYGTPGAPNDCGP